jgi:hypothetical protein
MVRKKDKNLPVFRHKYDVDNPAAKSGFPPRPSKRPEPEPNRHYSKKTGFQGEKAKALFLCNVLNKRVFAPHRVDQKFLLHKETFFMQLGKCMLPFFKQRRFIFLQRPGIYIFSGQKIKKAVFLRLFVFHGIYCGSNKPGNNQKAFQIIRKIRG